MNCAHPPPKKLAATLLSVWLILLSSCASLPWESERVSIREACFVEGMEMLCYDGEYRSYGLGSDKVRGLVCIGHRDYLDLFKPD